MAEYLRFVFNNIEPLRIADDSTSQSGQTTSLRYVPGSTIRGLVINALAKRDDFEDIKKILFSEKVRFLNAYIMENGKELIPSPKGFYEDKTEKDSKKEIQNVVATGSFSEGYKRASLGRYCYFEDGVINYYGVETGADLKIKIMLENENEKNNVFRNEYICPGYNFVGYIAIDDDKVKDIIFDSISEMIILGNARSTGLGKCKVRKKEFTSKIPYSEYSIKEDAGQRVYMMLMSDTLMRDEYGELCGIDTVALAKKMGVENLTIDSCSTSTVTVKGYNRKLGAKLPEQTMYELGSVFRLSFDGTFTKERCEALTAEGIGIRKNEGFGRVLFVDSYDKLGFKAEGKRIFEADSGCRRDSFFAEDEQVIKVIAQNYLRNRIKKAITDAVVNGNLPKGNAKNSQLGTIESLLTIHRDNFSQARRSLETHFLHANKKEAESKVQKEKTSIKGLGDFVLKTFDSSMTELWNIDEEKDIMGFPIKDIISQAEIGRFKIDYILQLIRYDNRKGDK